MSAQRSTRRQFLRTASATAAAAGCTTPYFFTTREANAEEPKSKNDRPHIAAIGLGGQGFGDTRGAARFGDVVAVCDVDRRRAEKAKKKLGGKADVYTDYREVLARDDVDVVVNGTPDHWHTAINVAACKAGKDMYAEKPLTLTIDEGKTLCRVVKDTGRVVQVGTQQRSERQFHTAIELVRNGRIGKLRQVWVALPYFSTLGGPFPAATPPEFLNWDFYQGQAPVHDYCKQRTHSNFRWWYDYAGGIVTDWGNHHIDIAQWGMDCEMTGPTSIEARGIFPNQGKPDCYQTADRFFARMQYANGVELLYFSALKNKRRYGDVETHQETTPEQVEELFGSDTPEEIKTFNRNGVMFVGDEGRVFVNRKGVYGKPVEELKKNPLPEDRWRVRPSRNHMGNLFECIASRQTPVSPVWMQHRTISTCHLVNISMRLGGRKLTWDPVAEQIVGDEEANAMQKRPQRAPYTIDA